MGKFDLNQYETVEARLQRYFKEYPDARVITKVEHQEENRIVIKAILYKNVADQTAKAPHATGLAEETRDTELKKNQYGQEYASVNYTSHVENCETSAVGRALANAGFSGNKNGQRASREEMQKVDRLTPHTTNNIDACNCHTTNEFHAKSCPKYHI